MESNCFPLPKAVTTSANPEEFFWKQQNYVSNPTQRKNKTTSKWQQTSRRRYSATHANSSGIFQPSAFPTKQTSHYILKPSISKVCESHSKGYKFAPKCHLRRRSINDDESFVSAGIPQIPVIPFDEIEPPLLVNLKGISEAELYKSGSTNLGHGGHKIGLTDLQRLCSESVSSIFLTSSTPRRIQKERPRNAEEQHDMGSRVTEITSESSPQGVKLPEDPIFYSPENSWQQPEKDEETMDIFSLLHMGIRKRKKEEEREYESPHEVLHLSSSVSPLENETDGDAATNLGYKERPLSFAAEKAKRIRLSLTNGSTGEEGERTAEQESKDEGKSVQKLRKRKRVRTHLSGMNDILKMCNSSQMERSLTIEETLELRRKEKEIEEAKRKERERIERERIEREREEQRKKQEKERLEKERLEKERLEKERLEKERLEKERLEKERQEKERQQREKQEKERLEKERQEKERLEKERQEKERHEKERQEREGVKEVTGAASAESEKDASNSHESKPSFLQTASKLSNTTSNTTVSPFTSSTPSLLSFNTTAPQSGSAIQIGNAASTSQQLRPKPSLINSSGVSFGGGTTFERQESPFSINQPPAAPVNTNGFSSAFSSSNSSVFGFNQKQSVFGTTSNSQPFMATQVNDTQVRDSMHNNRRGREEIQPQPVVPFGENPAFKRTAAAASNERFTEVTVIPGFGSSNPLPLAGSINMDTSMAANSPQTALPVTTPAAANPFCFTSVPNSRKGANRGRRPR